MAALSKSALIQTMFVLCVTLCVLPPCSQAQTLYGQGIRAALVNRYPGLELYLLDLRTEQPILNTFRANPIPVGSLLKPFVAQAYAATHAGFPTVVCHGHADGCWKAHGSMTLVPAIAQSCNTYFLALASDLTPANFSHIPPPPPESRAKAFIGLTPDWRLTPQLLTLAYAELLTKPGPGQQAILAGMRGSAEHGTASALGPHRGGVLAKTGTAPCTTHCLGTGDGLVLAAIPAAHPTLILLVRKRGTNGAATARAAGPILRQLDVLRAY